MELTSNNGGDVVQIILDISANTHKNDHDYYKKMIDELAKVDSHKHEVILKWQLFEKEGDNIIPNKTMFVKKAWWAFKTYGYKTTASVFDKGSLHYLIDVIRLPYELPFIKIANRRNLDWLIGEIPRKYKIYKSVGDLEEYGDWRLALDVTVTLFCVSNYPANMGDYPERVLYISDHTVGLELFHRNKPFIWEKHYKLSDSTGLDAGEFAITPEELREIL